jgi:Asp/Glu/hydantoin racemase
VNFSLGKGSVLQVIYRAKKGQVSYGEPIGILLLDTFAPFIPGDVGNATTYQFPVRYRVVKGFTVERLLFQKDTSALELLIEAGQELVKEGVKAITGDCGYMALFQRDLANALGVPVFMSSLLQVPLISKMLGEQEKVGIICAHSKSLDEFLLQAVGIDSAIPTVIRGMENCNYFYKAAIEEIGELDAEQIRKEVVFVAENMVAENPEVKAILLECSMLPPYSAAISEKLKIPVFDYITMINYVYSALVKKEYKGYM